MPVLYRDVESRSTLNLASVGTSKYSRDPSTEILCIGFAIDNAPAQIWTPDQPIPEAFITAATDPDWLIVAHNAAFEMAIETLLLHPRFGWPIIPIARHVCTMARCVAAALPGKLENAAAALGLEGKDIEGYRLMRQMSRPRKARKGEDANAVHWHDGPEHRARLHEYCQRDVNIERELYRRLPPLSAEEQALWCLDQEINRRGFHINRALAVAAREIVGQEQAAINARISELTDGKITTPNQVARIADFVRSHGHTLASLGKRNVSAVLAHEPADDVRQILELRRDGGRAAARKLDTLLAGLDDDDRLRGCFRYHGASTGRWSGTRFQPQNLAKPKLADLDAAAVAVLSGDLKRVREIGAPLAVVGDLSRNLITAAPGYVLFGADFSSVESRTLAWSAGEQWKLDVYREFDRTNNPRLEPYCVTATRILKRHCPVTPDDETERQIGKTADLACGYGGSAGAWRRFAPDDTRSDGAILRDIAEWRQAHPAIVHFWHALERKAHRTIRTGMPTKLGNKFAFEMQNGTLLITLPSGRRLSYPEARLVPGKFQGSCEICHKDNAKGGWKDRGAWYGDLVENAVSGIARDLLAASMMRVEAAGYAVTQHCHDECVCEVPEDFGNVDEFLQLMTALPAWATDLPVAAKAWRRPCYAKPAAPNTQQPIVALAPSSVPTIVPTIVVTPPEIEKVKTTAAPKATMPSPSMNGATIIDELDVAPRNSSTISTKALLVSLHDVIGQELVNGKMLCPFHDDSTPSLHIYNDHFHCFACEAHGDAVDWLMMIEGKTRDEALYILEDPDHPKITPQHRTGDEEKARTLAFALRLWEAAKPIAGTPAIAYLAEIRGIATDALPANVDAVLRFHPRCVFEHGKRAPCLIARYSDVATDEFAGIHRIALTNDVFAGAKVRRLTLGSWPAPKAIKLWPAGAQLFLGEGIETVLAAATCLQHEGAPMHPAWSAGSKNGIAKFPILPNVKRLALLVDHDAAGESCANDCRLTWKAAGREVTRLRPKRPGADFNDVVLERRRTVVLS